MAEPTTVESTTVEDISSINQTIRANTPVIMTTEILPKSTTKPSAQTHSSNTPSYRFYRSKSLRSDTFSSRNKLRKNIGIVTGDFTRMYPDELTLKLGERLEIISKHVDIGRWTAINSHGETGLVPISCVKVVTSSISTSEDIVIGTEGMYPIEIPPEEVKLCEVIGVGGFGRVHRAIYKGQEVAVKVAKHTNYDMVKVIMEVLAEAEKFSRLAHENVCALVGVSLVDDIYLVIEYAKGGSLSQIIHDRGLVVPVDVVLDWAAQITEGMRYLHHEVHPCMIHRDLKSSNILLQNTVDGTNFHNNIIKITDFGLARELEHTTRMSTAGTYPWMAPEVIKSSEFSTKSDVWSFGIVLWELLTGEKPYTGLNLYLVAYGVGSGKLKLPIHDECPRPLAILLQECWQRSYMDRPTFKTLVTTLNNMSCNMGIIEMDYERFKSLQLAWKLEIQKCFQEHKKNEENNGFEDKQKDLLSRMRNQDQRVIQLEKEKLHLVNMIEKFHSELQKLNDTEQRPSRAKPFSLRKMIEKMILSKDLKLRSSSKAENLAKEIERKMKDMNVTEDMLAKYSSPKPSFSTIHKRQQSDSDVGTGQKLTYREPIIAMQRSGSLNTKVSRTESKHFKTASQYHGTTQLPARRHNSYDNILPTTTSDKYPQFDSGKHSLTSSDTFSNDVKDLIDFDCIVTRPNLLADLDPLVQHKAIPSHIVPLHDSMFSDTISPDTGISPSPLAYDKHSPRSSITTEYTPSSIGLYPSRPNSYDSTSAPTSRPGTPRLQPQTSSMPRNISPSGSVHSLPHYPTNDMSYYTISDNSTSIDLDDTLFDPDNVITFCSSNPPPLHH